MKQIGAKANAQISHRGVQPWGQDFPAILHVGEDAKVKLGVVATTSLVGAQQAVCANGVLERLATMPVLEDDTNASFHDDMIALHRSMMT